MTSNFPDKIDITDFDTQQELLRQWQTLGLELDDETRFNECLQNQDYQDVFSKMPYDQILPQINNPGRSLFILSSNPSSAWYTNLDSPSESNYNYSYLEHLQSPHRTYKIVQFAFCEKVTAEKVKYSYDWRPELPTSQEQIELVKERQDLYSNSGSGVFTTGGFCHLSNSNQLIIFDDEIGNTENKFVIYREASGGKKEVVLEKTYEEMFDLINQNISGGQISNTYTPHLYFDSNGGFERMSVMDQQLDWYKLR